MYEVWKATHKSAKNNLFIKTEFVSARADTIFLFLHIGHRNPTYTVAFAPTVIGSVFMQRYRLFVYIVAYCMCM